MGNGRFIFTLGHSTMAGKPIIKKTISRKIAQLVRSGQPPKQAVSNALNNARRIVRKGIKNG